MFFMFVVLSPSCSISLEETNSISQFLSEQQPLMDLCIKRINSSDIEVGIDVNWN